MTFGRILVGLVLLCNTQLIWADEVFTPPWVFQPLPAQPPIPENNPLTAEKIALGKQLFFDARLSATGTHSCNSCHNLSSGGDDGLPTPVGVNSRTGERNTLTIWNAAFHNVFNWVGDTTSLEQQAGQHILDAKIMGMADANAVINKISAIAAYDAEFKSIFAKEGVSLETIGKALASYVRTLNTHNSAHDRFLRGDKQATSKAAQRGFKEFIVIGCASCHFWVNLAGPIPGLQLQQGEGFYELFPNYPGTDYERQYGLADDIGRYNYSKDETDRRMWRMPSLRNIAITAPYFHNGSVESLGEAVSVMAKTQLRKDLSDKQIADIVTFLETLTGQFPQQSLPRLP